MVPLQTLPNMSAAFKGGQVDAILVPVTGARALEAEKTGHILGWVGDETPWQTLILSENSTEAVRFTAMNPQAKRYTVRVRQAR